MLDTSTALVAAYYTLACQLFKNGYLFHSVEWYNRASATSLDFGLEEATCKYLSKMKGCAANAQSAQERPTRDRIIDTKQRNKGRRDRDNKEMYEERGENVRSSVSVDEVYRPSTNKNGNKIGNLDAGIQKDLDDDVIIDEDNSDNVDDALDTAVEENNRNFYKSRTERMAEMYNSQSKPVPGYHYHHHYHYHHCHYPHPCYFHRCHHH